MIYEVNDQSNYRQLYLVDFPEGQDVYEYYKSIFNEVGKVEEVTFTLVDEVPYGAKRYRYHSCPF